MKKNKNKRDYFLCHNKYIEQSTFTLLTNSLDRFKNQFEEKGYRSACCVVSIHTVCVHAEDKVQ